MLGLADAGQAGAGAVSARGRPPHPGLRGAASRPAGRPRRAAPGRPARGPARADLAPRAGPGRRPGRVPRSARPRAGRRAADAQHLSRHRHRGSPPDHRADLALGTSRDGRRLLAELRGDGFSYRDDAALAERYALTDAIAEGAEAEAAWLASPSPGVEVLDPHGLLTDWADPAVPEWYAEISRREAVVPALEPREDRETQLWRVRQERAAYLRRVQREQGRP